MKKYKILYIHHRNKIGGSFRSLLFALENLDSNSIEPYMICPRGEATEILKKNGIKVIETLGISTFVHTRCSYYHGLSWLKIIREILYLFPTVFAIIRSKIKYGKFDIVHINEFVMIIPSIFIKTIFKTPLVVHARIPLEDNKGKWRIKIIRNILRNIPDKIIAIDHTVYESLGSLKNTVVIHNGISQNFSHIINNKGIVNFKKERGIKENSVIFSMVGQLLNHKGIYDFVEAAKICIEKGLPCHFLIVGKNSISNNVLNSFYGKILRYFNIIEDTENKLIELIDKYGIKNKFTFEGFVRQPLKIFQIIDVLCFPHHAEAIGRPVFEAALYSKPSIVTLSNPRDNSIIPNETALIVPPKSPKELAKAMEELILNKEKCIKMGFQAKKHCEKIFDANKNSKKILELYKKIILKDI